MTADEVAIGINGFRTKLSQTFVGLDWQSEVVITRHGRPPGDPNLSTSGEYSNLATQVTNCSKPPPDLWSIRANLRVLIPAAFALTIALLFGFGSVDSQESIDVNDCFGGTVSDYPVHCGFLQDAHNARLIQIESIHRAGDGLFVFLAQEDAISDQIRESLRNVARAHVKDTLAGNWACDEYVYDVQGCLPGVLALADEYQRWLPAMDEYEEIFLIPGGNAALLKKRGWAAYDKLWPVPTKPPAGGQGAAGADSGQTGLDLSDIDLENLPPVDCGQIPGIHRINERNACNWWKRLPELNIAGVKGYGDELYVQIKATSDIEAKVAAAKTALIASSSRRDESNTFVIPVSHEFADLWKFRETLERFQWSAANTYGIDSPIYTHARDRIPGAVYPVAGVQPVPQDGGDLTNVRATIEIRAIKFQETIAALPTLLPKLGIPADAVGIVVPAGFVLPGPSLVAAQSPTDLLPHPGSGESATNQEDSGSAPPESIESGIQGESEVRLDSNVEPNVELVPQVRQTSPPTGMQTSGPNGARTTLFILFTAIVALTGLVGFALRRSKDS